MADVWHFLVSLLGLEAAPRDLTFLQSCARGVVVFLYALFLVRITHTRSLSRKTPFDTILLVIIGAVLSRAINGSAAFFPTLAASLLIVLLHRWFGSLAYFWHWFGHLIKGSPELLVQDGAPIPRAMRRNCISERDLAEDMRMNAHEQDVDKIAVAQLERSGDISFIKKKTQSDSG